MLEGIELSSTFQFEVEEGLVYHPSGKIIICIKPSLCKIVVSFQFALILLIKRSPVLCDFAGNQINLRVVFFAHDLVMACLHLRDCHDLSCCQENAFHYSSSESSSSNSSSRNSICSPVCSVVSSRNSTLGFFLFSTMFQFVMNGTSTLRVRWQA